MCSWKGGRIKEQVVSVPLGPGTALSWQSWVAQVGPGCSAMDPHHSQAARLKWSVGTDGWGTASKHLSCWGLRINHLETKIYQLNPVWQESVGSFLLLSGITDIDFFPQGIFLSCLDYFLTQTLWNKILSTGYIEHQSYAQPLIYCPMSLWSEWIGMTIWFKQLLLALPHRFYNFPLASVWVRSWNSCISSHRKWYSSLPLFQGSNNQKYDLNFFMALFVMHQELSPVLWSEFSCMADVSKKEQFGSFCW